MPCSAITGRSIPVWPGGMAITQLVLMPPRAAETNEPVILVGRGLPAVGGLERRGSLRWLERRGPKRGRRLRFERIQQGAERQHAGGRRAGTGAHAQYRTAFQVQARAS